MKKGQQIGMNSAIGASGEKYIYFDKHRKKYCAILPTGIIGKQKTLGRFNTLEDAVICRDKYLAIIKLK